jgi:hypothetical protein
MTVSHCRCPLTIGTQARRSRIRGEARDRHHASVNPDGSRHQAIPCLRCYLGHCRVRLAPATRVRRRQSQPVARGCTLHAWEDAHPRSKGRTCIGGPTARGNVERGRGIKQWNSDVWTGPLRMA